MTERFKFVCDDENCYFKDKDKGIDCYQVVKLLNELDSENQKLKEENEYLNAQLNLIDGMTKMVNSAIR